MLEHLAPARRRFFLGAAGLAVAVVVAIVVAVVVNREPPVDPVAQDRLGPVLLVPGYGGDATSLEVLGDALTRSGRSVVLVRPPDGGTGDLRDQAAHLDDVASDALGESGASSVDVVGYSAGGVVVRLWVKDLGGDRVTRRAVTLASPHHGTDLAGLAGDLGDQACPEACQQLSPDSDLLTELNQGDESPPGPRWVAIWTTDDATVVPPSSGSLDGALDFSVQSICPAETIEHPDVPRTPSVIAIVEQALGRAVPSMPGPDVC